MSEPTLILIRLLMLVAALALLTSAVVLGKTAARMPHGTTRIRRHRNAAITAFVGAIFALTSFALQFLD